MCILLLILKVNFNYLNLVYILGFLIPTKFSYDRFISEIFFLKTHYDFAYVDFTL